MPKEKEVTNHPCHLLSLPSAKRFWCRHCMTVFEDAITRWRHSRSCRYGAVNNFMRRRELEAKALQNTSVLNPVEARLEQSIQMCDLASSSLTNETAPEDRSQILLGPKSFNCLICQQTFASMEEMRLHVKYPCSNSKIITSHVPHPKHSVPVFIDALTGQTHHWQQASQQEVHQATAFVQASNPQQNVSHISYDIEIQSQQEIETHYDNTHDSVAHSGSSTCDGITPTNIYVNEQGETVIEVENLDLNSEGGELSLAHLLAQLSQQGIVFDKTRTAEIQSAERVISTASSATSANCQDSSVTCRIVEDEGQPTAEDAANTLAQLAGLRGFTRMSQIKNENETPVHSQVHAVQDYSYSNSVDGASDNTDTSELQLEIEYSDMPLEIEHPSVADNQNVFGQAEVSVPQGYENVKVEHQEIEDAIHFYTDASNEAYITDSGSHHQIQAKPGTTSSDEYAGFEVKQEEFIQEYSVPVKGSGRLINVSNALFGKQDADSLNVEHRTSSEDLSLIKKHDGTTVTDFKVNTPSVCTQTKEVTAITHLNKTDARESRINTEADEFIAQNVSEEAVECDGSAVTYVAQAHIGSNAEQFMSHVISEPACLTVEATSDCQRVQDEDSFQDLSAAMEEAASYPATVYIVTSTGVHPVGSDKP